MNLREVLRFVNEDCIEARPLTFLREFERAQTQVREVSDSVLERSAVELIALPDDGALGSCRASRLAHVVESAGIPRVS